MICIEIPLHGLLTVYSKHVAATDLLFLNGKKKNCCLKTLISCRLTGLGIFYIRICANHVNIFTYDTYIQSNVIFR